MDKMGELDTPEPLKISRRKFLKLAGLTLGALAMRPLGGVESGFQIRQLSSEQQLFLINHEICRGDTSAPGVIITYDDWPREPEQLEKILDAYKGKGEATFFILGNRLDWLAAGKLKDYGWKDTSIIQRIVDDGHQIGMHGWQHDIPMTQLSSSDLSRQFDQCLSALYKILPNYQTTFFRAPFGSVNENVLKIGAKYGLQHVMWNIESGGDTTKTYNYVIDGVSKTGNGAIVLSHMQRTYDVNQASDIVSSLLENGLVLKTVEDGISSEDKLPSP